MTVHGRSRIAIIPRHFLVKIIWQAFDVFYSLSFCAKRFWYIDHAGEGGEETFEAKLGIPDKSKEVGAASGSIGHILQGTFNAYNKASAQEVVFHEPSIALWSSFPVNP